MLAVLTRDQLDRSMFPLGDSTKAQVRAEAAARGLAVADKPDSHDICFIADGDTQGFLATRLGRRPGRHRRRGHRRGARPARRARTATPIGQRKGLRPGPAGAGRPAALRAVDHAGDQHRRGRAGRGAGRHRSCTPTAGVDGLPAGAGGVRCGRDGADAGARRRPRARRYGRRSTRDGMCRDAGSRRYAGSPPARPSWRTARSRRRHRARLGHDHRAAPTPRRAGRWPSDVTARFPWAPGSATGIGSLPGTDIVEAVKIGLRRAAGSAVPARAARPGPGRRHDRPYRRAARRDAGRAVRGAVAGRVAPGAGSAAYARSLGPRPRRAHRCTRPTSTAWSRCRWPARGRSPPRSTCRSAAGCCAIRAPSGT